MNYLLAGCGSKWGKSFTDHLLNCGHSITLITGSDVEASNNLKVIKVDWLKLDIEEIAKLLTDEVYDVVFFNQNSAGYKASSCINPIELNIDHYFPITLLELIKHKLTSNSKIGWMITGLIKNNDPTYFVHSGYCIAKYANLAVMRDYSVHNKEIYFVMDPGRVDQNNYTAVSETLYAVINKLTHADSGKWFDFQGNEREL